MADKLMRAQVSIPLDSNVPEDAIVNTWHFDGDDALGAQPVESYHNAVMTLLTGFYQAVDGSLFPETVGPEATVKIYDMRDAEPRQVEHQGVIALTPSVVAPMAGEVSLCLSFKAADESGVPPARRRGRIFLGPIHQNCGEVVNSQLRPLQSKLDDVAAAAAALQEGELLNIGDPERVRWSIYSRATDLTQDIGLAFNDVLTGWVDNAFDTQRRRGCSPTSRTTF